MSLQSLPAAELESIHATLAAERFDDDASTAAAWNHAQYANFLEQVRTWLEDARGRPVAVGLRARG